MWWIVGVVGLVVLASTHVTWTASRVDRLHARAVASQAALDAALVRRAQAAVDLADHADQPQLRDAAQALLDQGSLARGEVVLEDRSSLENDLTRALRRLPAEVLTGDGGVDDGTEIVSVVGASRRAALSRQVHNDLVRDALAMRRRRLVRLLRLNRRHPEPTYFDVDNPILDQPSAA